MPKISYPIIVKYIKKSDVLYPITNEYVVAERDEEPPWIDTFDDYILEYYNTIPSLPRLSVDVPIQISGTVKVGMTVAWRNMSYRESEDAPNILETTMSFSKDDSIGVGLLMLNGIGETSVPEYPSYSKYIARGGWRGITCRGHRGFVSGIPTWDESIISTDNQPKVIVGANSDIITLEDTHTIGPYSDTTDEFVQMAIYDVGNSVYQITERTKDVVFWVYEYYLDIDGERFSDMSMLETGASDDLFSAKSQGIRRISNKWKYAPWERYPNL